MKLSDLFINDSQILEVRVSRDSVEIVWVDPWDKKFVISMSPHIGVHVDPEVVGLELDQLRELNSDGRSVEFLNDDGDRVAVKLTPESEIRIRSVD